MPEFRAVVSGGGIVGLAAAHSLARHGYETLLLDKPQRVSSSGTFGLDLRSVALSPIAVAQLAEYRAETCSNVGYIDSMHVWESDGSASITMTADAVGEPHLAAVFESNRLVASLRESLPSEVTLHANEGIDVINVASQTLVVDGIGELNPELLIVAEGTNSRTCERLGCTYAVDHDLEHRAIATIIEMEEPHESIAHQVFGPTPLALLPLARQHLRSLIWSLPRETADEFVGATEAAFMDKLNRCAERIGGALVRTDRRMSFPLRQRLIDDFNPLPWVLVVGDAAHTVHPLAGQGVNLGLEDVRALASCLSRRPRRLDKSGLWRGFNAKRKFRASSMLKLMSFFSNVYATQSPYMRLLRNAGVRFVDQNHSLKQQLIREAMGIGPIANVA